MRKRRHRGFLRLAVWCPVTSCRADLFLAASRHVATHLALVLLTACLVALTLAAAPTPALAADTAPPILRIVRPEENAISNDVYASVTIYYYDSGSGVDLSSLRFRVDQRDVTPAIRRSETLLIYLPLAPWTGGEHRIQVELSDLAGNRAALEWRFYTKSATQGLRIGDYSITGQLKSEAIWDEDLSLSETLVMNFADAPGGLEVMGRVNASIKRSAVPDRSVSLVNDYWANLDSFWLEASRPGWRVEAGDVVPVTGHEMSFGPTKAAGFRAGAALGSDGWASAGWAGTGIATALFANITALQADWTKGKTGYGIAGAALNDGESYLVDAHVSRTGERAGFDVSAGASDRSGQPGSSVVVKSTLSPWKKAGTTLAATRLQGTYQRTTASYANGANPSLPLDRESLTLTLETQAGLVGVQGELSRGTDNLDGTKDVTKLSDKAAVGLNLPQVAGWAATLRGEGNRTSDQATGEPLVERTMVETDLARTFRVGEAALEFWAGVQHTDLTESETDDEEDRVTTRDRVTCQSVLSRGKLRVILDLEDVRETLPLAIQSKRQAGELAFQYGTSTDKSGAKATYRHENGESWSLEDSGAFVRVVRDKATLEGWTSLGPNRLLTAELTGDTSHNTLGHESPWTWQARVGVTWVF